MFYPHLQVPKVLCLHFVAEVGVLNGNTALDTVLFMINYWKPINQYALYSVMFCLLYSNISKEQHEKHLCNPSSHYGNTENILVKRAPHISIRESHDASISAMLNSFHNIVSKGTKGSTLMQAL